MLERWEKAMTPIICTLSIALLVPADAPPTADAPRQPNPLAPSLRLLSPREEKQIDGVIDRFIQYDTGQLRGEDGKRALADFQKLGPDSIPALIRGLNRSAHIEASCPAVTIGRKLAAMLRTSNDPELLDFARENIGLGVTESRHLGVIKDLRLTCILRKRALPRQPVALRTTVPTAAPANLPLLSVSQLLEEAVKTEPGQRRDHVVAEMDRRRREEVVPVLATVAEDGANKKSQQQARELLDHSLSGITDKELRDKLKDDLVEVRASAARVVGEKGLHYDKELIDLLEDDNGELRQAARMALMRLNARTDFGPTRTADAAERARAVRRWRDWLTKQDDR
jgi:hypothetical protein